MSETTLFPELPPAVKVTRGRQLVTVEAVRMDAESDPEAIAEWCGGHTILTDDKGWIVGVPGPYGTVYATEGNWIVKGIMTHGTHAFMVYEATAFADTYEQVTP